ncbi:hypothetical protein MHTCC0001_05340 [Flavobacteriaceae bacterium MHTCC 0001]
MKTILLNLFLLLSLSITGQSNLVVNGDFETWDSFQDNLQDWSRYFDGWWEHSSDVQEGNSSVHLEIKNNAFSYISSEEMQFTTGKTYVCSLYYKLVTNNITSIEFDLYHTPNVFPEKLMANEYTSLTSSTWTKLEFEFTATATEMVEIWIRINGSDDEAVLFDNAVVQDKATLSNPILTDAVNEFKMYPNPTLGSQEVTFNKEVNYNLVDITGKTVLSNVLSSSVNVDNLKDGMYFFVIDGEVTKKLIVN